MWEITINQGVQMTAEETDQWTAKFFNQHANAGMILLKIREEKGWAAKGFSSFKDFCGSLDEQMGARKAYYLTDQAEVNRSLSQSTGKHVELPLAHALALKDLEPEQRLLAFNEATAGKSDARPTAKVFERVARRLAPAETKKRKAGSTKPGRKDNDGWSKEELEKDVELAMAFVSLGVFGPDDIKALKNGTVPMKRADVLYMAKLPKPKLLEIQDLVFGNRWTPQEAVKFVNSMPDANSTLEEMQNYCLATKGKFYEATINGFTHTVKANRAARR